MVRKRGRAVSAKMLSACFNPSDSIPIVLGVDEHTNPVWIDLAKDASHMVIQGKTRSGKSQCTYNLLAQVARNPSVRVVGSDPTNVLLAPFLHRVNEPHIVLGLNDSPKTVEVLRWVKEESDRRIDLMWDRRIDKFSHFSPTFPLILLVLEEYPGIIEAATDADAADGLSKADKCSPRIQALVRQIAAQSAKAGIRILLLAQRADANILGGPTRSNFATKLTLRVDEPEAIRMLHPSVTPEECSNVEMFVPGMGYFEGPGQKRRIIRCSYVGDYSGYAREVESSDPRFLALSETDREQQLRIIEEFPEDEDEIE